MSEKMIPTTRQRKVQFEELNTIQGQRLAQARAKLKERQMEKAPKRQDGEKPLRRYQRKENLALPVLPIKKIPFLKKVVYSVAFALGAGSVLMVGIGLSWLAFIAVTSFVGLAFYETVNLKQRIVNNQKQALIKKPRAWIATHRFAYQIGYQSKNITPYLKSYFKGAAYADYGAYKIGLEESMANKRARI